MSAPVPAQRVIQLAVTGALVVGPFAGLVAAVWLLWGRGIGVADLGLAVFFYLLTGFGVTVGFHRCLTHRSFTARPALRVALAVAGSMSFQGDVNGWVATHRRHHAFTDRPGDPHSPYRYGTGPAGQLRGVLHAHAGWMFGNDPTSPQRYAPDMLADRAMRRVSSAFPALCAASLALPFAAGWAIGGARAALLALLWAGLVRVFLLQHVTWSVNSLCHLLGSRPFTTRRHDRATNLWPLAVLSLGRAGTTCTTPTRPAPGMALTAASSTCPPCSSASSSAQAGSGPSAGPALPGSSSTGAATACVARGGLLAND